MVSGAASLVGVGQPVTGGARFRWSTRRTSTLRRWRRIAAIGASTTAR